MNKLSAPRLLNDLEFIQGVAPQNFTSSSLQAADLKGAQFSYEIAGFSKLPTAGQGSSETGVAPQVSTSSSSQAADPSTDAQVSKVAGFEKLYTPGHRSWGGAERRQSGDQV